VKGSGSIWLHAERYRHVTPDQVYSVVGRSTNYLAYVNGQLPSVAAVKARLAYEVYPTSYDGGLIGGPAQGRGLLGGIKNFLSGGLIVNTIIRAGCDMVRSVSSDASRSSSLFLRACLSGG